MNFFSSTTNNLVLVEYDILHISAILFFAIAIILTIIFRKNIRQSKHEKTIRYVATFLAIAFEVIFKIWYGVTKQGTFLDGYLPLDLCAISLYLMWVLMISNKKWIFKLVYFYSIGALVSLFIPDMAGFGPDHFRYYHYFYVHGYIIWGSIYYVAVRGYKIRFKDFLVSSAILVIIAAFVMGIDFLTNTNYMFLHHKPEISTPLDLLGPWPEYIYGLLCITVVLFFLWYVPWFFTNRKKNKAKALANEHNNIAA